MREHPAGGPLPGPTARTLGVRPDDDLPVVAAMVRPGTGGMSVAPEPPTNLPEHRRPRSLQGSGKDPVWGIPLDQLGNDLTYRQDRATHGLIEPAREMTIGAYQQALAGTAPRWLPL